MTTLTKFVDSIQFRHHTDGSSDLTVDERTNAINEFSTKLDLDTGPFGKGLKFGKKFRIKVASDRDGLEPDYFRQMFLNDPNLPGDESNVDTDRYRRFAKAIVDSKTGDGIYGIAGVRGSGKSSLLNAIAKYSDYVLPGQRTLAVKFDLGVEFDGKNFSRDLVRTISQAARGQLRGEVHSESYRGLFKYLVFSGLNSLSRVIGRFAVICNANAGWSFSVLATLVFLLSLSSTPNVVSASNPVNEVMQHILTSVSGKKEANESDSPPKKSEIGNDKSSTESASIVPDSSVQKLRQAVASTVDGGSNSSSEELEVLARLMLLLYGASDVAAPAVTTGPYILPFLGKIDVNTIAVLFCLFAVMTVTGIVYQIVPPSMSWSGASGLAILVLLGLPFLVPSQLFASAWAVGLYGFLCIALPIFLLPKWWHNYEELGRLGEAGDKSNNLFSVGVFGVIGQLIATFLPSRYDKTDIENMSIPFVQELLKKSVMLCSDFTQVIILIDDVDALPQTQHAALLRLLRPLSKVNGVRCLISVPIYYHHVMRSGKLGDLQSTLRDVVVLGDDRIFSDEGGLLQPAPYSRHLLEKRDIFLAELLVSKIRAGVLDPDISQQEIVHFSKSQLFKDSIIALTSTFKDKDTIDEMSIEHQEKLWLTLLGIYGQSRREFVRLLSRSIRAWVTHVSFSDYEQAIVDIKNEGDNLLKDHAEQECALEWQETPVLKFHQQGSSVYMEL